jgi:hypothetical protein
MAPERVRIDGSWRRVLRHREPAINGAQPDPESATYGSVTGRTATLTT